MQFKFLGCAVAASLFAPLALAQPVSPQVHQLPFSTTTSFESLRLGHGERLGLLGLGVLFEPDEHWAVGPQVYGAASGSRGGFFVGGVALERRWQVSARNELKVGAFAGGGGGGGAAVGGGLMLKLSLGLQHDFGPVKAGVFVSRIDFPNGHIRSNQAGVMLSWDSNYNYFDAMWAGESVKNTLRGGLGFDRIAFTAARHQLSAASQTNSRTLDAVGIRADRWLDPHWYAGIEAGAAAHGGADGYAEGLATLGWEHDLRSLGLPALSVGARGALGLGGGGAVKTGGGVIAKAGAGLRLKLTPTYSIGLEGGAVRSLGGHDHARYAQLLLGMDFDRPNFLTGRIDEAGIQRNEWALSVEHVSHAARKMGPALSLDTVGLKLNHYLSDHLYLTGQAHSAFAGHAGAYSVGLVGLGVDLNTDRSAWSAGAELLAGAAGGGGVYTEGGAIAQALGWVGVPVTRNGQLRLGAGRIKSLRGGLDSPVFELSWTQAFGLAGH